MKNILILLIIIVAVVVIFGNGPTVDVSPEFSNKMSSNMSYTNNSININAENYYEAQPTATERVYVTALPALYFATALPAITATPIPIPTLKPLQTSEVALTAVATWQADYDVTERIMQITKDKNIQLPDYWFLWNTEEKEQWVRDNQ